MNFGRRRFLGAFAGTAATVLFPRTAANAVPPVPAPGFDPWHLGGSGAAVPAEPVATGFPGAPDLLPRAIAAMQRHEGRIAVRDVIGIVDFARASREGRFHLVDLAGGRVLSTHLVAHGKGSDPANSGMVERLSNRPGSEASCSGAFLTGELYSGQHGHARRLAGLDPENDQAQPRGIVIHGADYVHDDLVAIQGRIGRSQGCFAVSRAEIATVLARLGPGRLLFAAR